MKVAVSQIAADQKTGMTLAELAEFVKEAYRRDIPTESVIHAADIGWRGQIRKLETR